MKRIYCALLLVCCTLLFCSELGGPALAGDSSQQIGVTSETEFRGCLRWACGNILTGWKP